MRGVQPASGKQTERQHPTENTTHHAPPQYGGIGARRVVFVNHREHAKGKPLMANPTYTTPGSGSSFRRVSETMTATGQTGAILLTGKVAVQITGVATVATIQMQRSTQDPGGTANWAPVGDAISGNPSTGMQVQGFYEPGAAYWRANVTSLTGASVDIDIQGGRG